MNYGPRPTTVADLQACVGPGWGDIIARLVADLEKLGWDGDVHQVKEKFGGLRFYVGAEAPGVGDRIVQAESESLRTCEECGSPGEARGGWWIKTLCDACEAKR